MAGDDLQRYALCLIQVPGAVEYIVRSGHKKLPFAGRREAQMKAGAPGELNCLLALEGMTSMVF